MKRRRRPRDIWNRRVPKPGTLARRIYDMMDSEATPKEISEYLGCRRSYVTQVIWIIKNSKKHNKYQSKRQKIRRLNVQ